MFCGRSIQSLRCFLFLIPNFIHVSALAHIGVDDIAQGCTANWDSVTLPPGWARPTEYVRDRSLVKVGGGGGYGSLLQNGTGGGCGGAFS